MLRLSGFWRGLVLIAMVLGLSAASVRAVSPVVADINGDQLPGNFFFAGNIVNIGWNVVADTDFTLDGIFTTFRTITSPAVTPREVTLSFYQGAGPGGPLQRMGAFMLDSAGGEKGIEFAPFQVMAGQTYFIALENVAGAGLNIVDFDVSLPGGVMNENIDFQDGWYTGADFSTFNSVDTSPGFAAPIFRFTGPVPEPAAALMLIPALGLLRRRRV